MTPERWRQIEELYHAAREREPTARAEFLAQADPELRGEVESLLAQSDSTTAMTTQAGPLTHGSQLGPYRIEAAIGTGGMGEVYLATDTRLHRTVAIKTLPRNKVADPERRRRFLQEARAASVLNHPSIVTVYDIASDAGVEYLVMEYVAGKSLDKVIQPKGLPLEEVIDYALEIATALTTAHAAGIVHRDIKPANVMVTAGGNIKILDFGLAKLEERTSGPEDATRTIGPALTEAGMVMGTVAYMSPEQARGENVDARTDLFSFGAMLYEMASGRRAFPKALDWTTPPADVLPAELRGIALKLLETDRELRYQHASEVRADLQRLKRDADSAKAVASIAPTGKAGSSKRRTLIFAVASAITVAVAAYLLMHQTLLGAPKLTDKDTIVLADFRNSTGDPVFDETLRQGLSVELEQSPFLSLISEQRIQQILPLMAQSPDARLTSELASQICTRTTSAAVLEGSIARLGSQYVVGLSARRCGGDLLDDEQVQVAQKEDVLNALSQIARKFRAKVGESLALIRKHSTPLAEATTPSLDALKAYSTGWKVTHSKGSVAGLPYFKHAISLDPRFAMAYAFLGRIYGDIGENDLSAENTAKAYELKDRASDSEKFFITATYDQQVTGNLEKAQEAFELWAQDYPREYEPPGLLAGAIYPVFGKYTEMIEQAKKAIALDPTVPFGYVNLTTAYQFLDRLPEAEATLQAATLRKLEIPELLIERYDLGFLRDDKTEMEQAVKQSSGKVEAEEVILFHEALVLAYSGHMRQARKTSERAANLAHGDGEPVRSALFKAGTAVWDALSGNVPVAKTEATEALKLSRDRDVEYGAALALALSGETVSVQSAANDLAARFPEDTSVQNTYLPVLRALLALSRGEPAKAIEALQAAAQDELGVPQSWYNGAFGALYPIYVRGTAYLAARQGAEAAGEFQKILNHRGIVANDFIGPLARLQLGRALALAGNRTGAKAAYTDFLALWKDADTDSQLLQKASAEYARL